MGFPRQSSIGACQNLERCVAFPRTPPKRMLRQCFIHYICMFTCSNIPTPDLGTALIENYVHDNVFVLVAFHGIQWQEDCLCPVTLRKIWKSSIPINWIWSIFTENQKLKIWSSTNFSLNQPDCISSSICRTCSHGLPQKSALNDGAMHSMFSFDYFRIFWCGWKELSSWKTETSTNRIRAYYISGI